ncbi:MAG: thioredoxin-disulfide reductase [Bacteroidales bacterium]|nr:thioredoxin-disulfide reductase [Bacteroidales bacterium]
MTNTNAQILIVGSGPAGYTAAIYAARAGRRPVLIDGLLQGGQLTQTTEIENFPGFPNGRMGFELMQDMRDQALRLGTEMLSGEVVSSDLSSRPFRVTLDDGSEIRAESLIVATGASAKYLGLADEQKYAGAGVSACATCDGFFFRGKDVAVVGGGDTAAEEALYLAGLARKVYMIARRDVLRASQVMRDRLAAAPNVEILYGRETVGLVGDGKVEGAVLRNKATGGMENISISGFFLAIGHTPNTLAFPQLETDEQGYIRVGGRGQQTNIDGVFAAGDVCDPTYRQAVTAAASGCRAALDAERFLLANGF